MTVRTLLKELNNLSEEYLDVDVQVYDDSNDKFYKVEHLDFGIEYGDDEVQASKFYLVTLTTNLLVY